MSKITLVLEGEGWEWLGTTTGRYPMRKSTLDERQVQYTYPTGDRRTKFVIERAIITALRSQTQTGRNWRWAGSQISEPVAGETFEFANFAPATRSGKARQRLTS